MSFVHSLIVVPAVFFVLLIVVFAGQLGEKLTNLEFLYNCPYPMQNEHAIIGSPPVLPFGTIDLSARGATYVNYTIANRATATSNSSGTGQFFQCYLQTNTGIATPSLNTSQPDYGRTVVYFPIGWFAWLGDSASIMFAKGSALVGLLGALVTAPSQVTGNQIFNEIEIILVLFMGVGGFLAVRGSGAG